MRTGVRLSEHMLRADAAESSQLGQSMVWMLGPDLIGCCCLFLWLRDGAGCGVASGHAESRRHCEQ